MAAGRLAADLAALNAGKPERAALALEWRRRRNAMDIGGGAVVFALTFVLFYGLPLSGPALCAALMTVGIGAGGGAATAWLRGRWAVPLWFGVSVLDLLLTAGADGVFRLIVNTCLGAGIGLTRRMDQ